jgi:hypothetical protein
MPFRPVKPKANVKPLDGEVSKPFVNPESDSRDVFIVDNEDAGFEMLSDHNNENWLRRSLRRLFRSDNNNKPYVSMNIFRPPDTWKKVTGQDFYGQFVRSGCFKKSGEGKDKIAWNVLLDKPGDYDIYFYNEIPIWAQRGFRRGMDRQARDRQTRGRQSGSRRPRINPGKKYFSIYHEYGVDEIVFDLNETISGWNLLGTYRLPAGKNKIELTDKNDSGYVTADAIKWVKH